MGFISLVLAGSVPGSVVLLEPAVLTPVLLQQRNEVMLCLCWDDSFQSLYEKPFPAEPPVLQQQQNSQSRGFGVAVPPEARLARGWL